MCRHFECLIDRMPLSTLSAPASPWLSTLVTDLTSLLFGWVSCQVQTSRFVVRLIGRTISHEFSKWVVQSSLICENCFLLLLNNVSTRIAHQLILCSGMILNAPLNLISTIIIVVVNFLQNRALAPIQALIFISTSRIRSTQGLLIMDISRFEALMLLLTLLWTFRQVSLVQ